MAYSDVALLANDLDFMNRTRAAVAAEGEDDVNGWVQVYQWQMASAPGFGDAYASALAANVENPGNDQSVISDPMLLSAVQAIRTNSPGQ